MENLSWKSKGLNEQPPHRALVQGLACHSIWVDCYTARGPVRRYRQSLWRPMDFVWDRPLSTREILVFALRLIREHGRVLVRLALGPLLIGMAVDFASRALPAESLAIIPVLLIVVALYVYAETRAGVAAWELLHNRTVDPTMVIIQVRRRWTTIVLTYVLKWVLILLGLLLFIVPGVLLMLRWFAVPLTNAVEGLGIRTSLRRSRTLARGNRRQIFATMAMIDFTIGAVMIGCTIAAIGFHNGSGTGVGEYSFVAVQLSLLAVPCRIIGGALYQRPHTERGLRTMTRGTTLALTVGALLTASSATAQEPDGHTHGVGRLGRVSFPVSCTPEAIRRFEHAMAGLHSFWFEDGARAFGAVLQADATCAMAHWGLALNAWGNPFAGGPSGDRLKEGSGSAERAAANPVRSARERGFIAAVAALYRDTGGSSNAVRLQAYADTMARLYRDNSGDTEVTIFYALSLLATAPRTDTTFAQQKRALAILDPLYARHPDHPGLAHYIIHSADSPQLAALGLGAARRYADIAPAAPHAQHMPSHIFIRLGLWDEAVATNWKSYHSGVAHAKATGPWTTTGEGLHALDYAVYGYLQRGQDSAARAAVAVAHAGSIAPSVNVLIGQYNRTAMAARIPLEQGDWKAAAAFPAPDPAAVGVTAALSRFTRAIGAARSGDVSAARTDIAALDTIALDLAAKKDTYWARVAGIKRDAAAAWVQFAGGDTSGGLVTARAAADIEDVTDKHPVTPAELLPARELLGDMLLAAGRYPEARAAYQATLRREPGRARSLFGTARAAHLAGDRAGAVAGYREFLKLMSKADGQRPELAIARALAP